MGKVSKDRLRRINTRMNKLQKLIDIDNRLKTFEKRLKNIEIIYEKIKKEYNL